MASTSPSLTVVITVYNEEGILGKTIARTLVALEATLGNYELLIIDDASKDGSFKIAEEHTRRNPRIRAFRNTRNLNQGGCYKKSIELATKEYHMLLPGDDMVESESLKRLLASTGHADMSLISIDNYEIRHFVRRLISKTFVGVLNLLFGYHLRYFNGPTIVKTELLRSIEVSTSFMFISDTIIKLLDKGVSYEVVPVHFNPSDKAANMRPVHRNFFPVVANLLQLFWTQRLKRMFRLDK